MARFRRKILCLTLPPKGQAVWDFLTKPHPRMTGREKDFLCYLALWSFVPLFVFSIPSVKEVTYLLPSYAGIVLLVICYLFDRLCRKEAKPVSLMRCFVLPLLGFALTVQGLAKCSLILLFVCSALLWGWLIVELCRAIRFRDYRTLLLTLLAAMIGGVMLGNTPELMLRTRLDRKCYCQLAEKVWEKSGNCRLCVMTKEESIRGALPFYGKKDLRLLVDKSAFWEIFPDPGRYAFLLYEEQYAEFLQEPRFVESLAAYQVISPGFRKKADTFVLLVPKDPQP